MQNELAQASNFIMSNKDFAENVTEIANELIKIQNIYESAAKEVTTKLEILDSEFQARNQRNPIHQIMQRVKSPQSIIEKLIRKGLDVDLDTAREKLNDIAGIRVICSYIDDIYMVADMLMNQNDIDVISVIDYIKNPKVNGYRSLHLVLKVPVFFSDRMEKIKVEVQFRTIAMDFWASLEHHLHYKAMGNIPNSISMELKDCAEVIANADLKMQSIHNKVDRLYPEIK